MVSSGFFIAMAVLALVLLIIITIASIYGAIALSQSSYFNTNSKVKNAHSYLTASSVIGSITLFVLFILVIYILIKKPFSSIEVTEAFITNKNPSPKDILLAFASEKQLKEGETGRSLILVVFIILTFLVLFLAFLCLLAAYEMSQVLVRDQKAVDGANAAFIGSLAGIIEVFVVFIIAIFSYSLKNEAQEDIKKLDESLAPAVNRKTPITKKTVTEVTQVKPVVPTTTTVVTASAATGGEKSNYDILCEAYPDNPFCQ